MVSIILRPLSSSILISTISSVSMHFLRWWKIMTITGYPLRFRNMWSRSRSKCILILIVILFQRTILQYFKRLIDLFLQWHGFTILNRFPLRISALIVMISLVDELRTTDSSSDYSSRRKHFRPRFVDN